MTKYIADLDARLRVEFEAPDASHAAQAVLARVSESMSGFQVRSMTVADIYEQHPRPSIGLPLASAAASATAEVPGRDWQSDYKANYQKVIDRWNSPSRPQLEREIHQAIADQGACPDCFAMTRSLCKSKRRGQEGKPVSHAHGGRFREFARDGESVNEWYARYLTDRVA